MRRENLKKVAVCAALYLFSYAFLLLFAKYGESKFSDTFHWRVVSILIDAYPFFGTALAVLLYFEIRFKK